MKCSLLIAMLGALLSSAGAAPVIAFQERVWHFYSHPSEPPSTLSERLEAADLVVLGTIQSRGVELDFPATEKVPKITTTSAFVVKEVVKGGPFAVPSGAHIRVFREGGEVKRNGETLRVINHSLPDLEPGDYVLFLRGSRTKQGYEVMWAADGVFHFASDNIRSPGNSRLNRESEVLTPGLFLSQLRSAAKQVK